MTQQQFEIAIPSKAVRPGLRRRHLRAARARWWFDRMRHVVESATEWTPPGRPRSEAV